MNELQDLVGRLKENKDMQVETTTLGKFLGAESNKIALVLGQEILSRPVIVTKRGATTQLLDVPSGFVVSFNSPEDMMQKLVNTFSSSEHIQRQAAPVEAGQEAKPVEQPQERCVRTELCECRAIMYRNGCTDDRMTIVEKSIRVLDEHKAKCAPDEMKRVDRAQEKLNKLITHTRSKRLAPGQIPSVYEIAVWEWVKTDSPVEAQGNQ